MKPLETELREDVALQAKEERLQALVRGYGSVAVAYSGGVDSTYLAAVAHETLGDRARMILADSPSIPRSEVSDAVAIARQGGWNLTVIRTEEFDDENFAANGRDRCYFCKSELFDRMQAYAAEHEIAMMAYGSIVDDRLDYRPGETAARERRVAAPLQEVELSKEEIRALSRRRKLRTASKASFACLASRFPTGTRVTPEGAAQVEAAEEVLKRFGFRQYRARHHGDVCRVEIDMADVELILQAHIRESIVAGIRDAGYRHVALDLAGYRTGSTAAGPEGGGA